MLSLRAFVHASHSAKQFRLLQTLNTSDALTDALNRRTLNSDLKAALFNSERNGIQQLLAILDLDYFKTVNDKYGHAVGEHILKSLSRQLRHTFVKMIGCIGCIGLLEKNLYF